MKKWMVCVMSLAGMFSFAQTVVQPVMQEAMYIPDSLDQMLKDQLFKAGLYPESPVIQNFYDVLAQQVRKLVRPTNKIDKKLVSVPSLSSAFLRSVFDQEAVVKAVQEGTVEQGLQAIVDATDRFVLPEHVVAVYEYHHKIPLLRKYIDTHDIYEVLDRMQANGNCCKKLYRLYAILQGRL